jgi:deazaflavin-dependent oxidoreductase (nitroreductase family)
MAMKASNMRPPSATPQRLSRKDRIGLFLEHELDKRLAGMFVGLYRLTHGRITRLWKVDVLLLTTRGRRSGQQRTVVLQFFRDRDQIVVVAANGGRSTHPSWFYNLTATPAAWIQVMDRTLLVRAQELSADEAAAFWPCILRRAPGYARYQKATSRVIPLVRLVPSELAA